MNEVKDNNYTQGAGSYSNTGSNYSVNGGMQNNGYQYSGYDNNPPKKKKKGKKILVSFIALLLVAGLGTGAVYVAKSKDISLKGLLESKDKDEEVATTENVDDANKTEEPLVVATDVSALIDKVMPSIVSIDNTFMVDLEEYGYEDGEGLSGGTGSGVILGQNDTELLIVSNNHVVENADDLSVNFVNGTTKKAYIKGTNSGMDLAVIAVPLSEIDDATMNAIAFVEIGDSDTLKLGEPAIAIGNALGQGQSVTVGVISALNRKLLNEDGSEAIFIQTDASINHGNSGGALLNSKGQLIGINSRKAVTSDAEGMGYAIPISVAKPIIDGLMESGSKQKASKDNRGVLGVTAYTPTGVEGAYISSVDSGSAADEAGLEVGDIIIQIEDAKIASRTDLDTNMAYYEAGQTIKITVLRKGSNGYEEVEVEVTLKEQKSSNSSSKDDDKKSDDKKDSDDDNKGSDDYEDGDDYDNGDGYDDGDDYDEEDPEKEDDEEDDSDGGDDFGF